MKNTSLLCLSSPADDANYYSTLMGLKRENGEPFFIVVDCFQICGPCQKLDRAKQILCSHVKSTTPWLSSRKIRDLKALYKSSPEDAIREFGGIVMSDHLPALCKEEVVRAFAQERITTLAPPKYIFTSCDPTGGGPSQLAMCSGYYTALGDFVVSLYFFYFVKYICSAHKTVARTTSIMVPVLNGSTSTALHNSPKLLVNCSK